MAGYLVSPFLWDDAVTGMSSTRMRGTKRRT